MLKRKPNKRKKKSPFDEAWTEAQLAYITPLTTKKSKENIKLRLDNILQLVNKALELDPTHYNALKMRADIHKKLDMPLHEEADRQTMKEIENERSP